jgi:hypothetical protein
MIPSWSLVCQVLEDDPIYHQPSTFAAYKGIDLVLTGIGVAMDFQCMHLGKHSLICVHMAWVQQLRFVWDHTSSRYLPYNRMLLLKADIDRRDHWQRPANSSLSV